MISVPLSQLRDNAGQSFDSVAFSTDQNQFGYGIDSVSLQAYSPNTNPLNNGVNSGGGINLTGVYAAVGVIGGILLIGVILGAVFLARRRNNRKDLVPQVSVDLRPTISDIPDEWNEITGVEIKERLGGGNFGQVFRGEEYPDLSYSLGVWQAGDVALKLLNSQDQQNVLHEASVLQKLRHPNIVQVSQKICIIDEGSTLGSTGPRKMNFTL
jgi:hypothetical protein